MPSSELGPVPCSAVHGGFTLAGKGPGFGLGPEIKAATELPQGGAGGLLDGRLVIQQEINGLIGDASLGAPISLAAAALTSGRSCLSRLLS